MRATLREHDNNCGIAPSKNDILKLHNQEDDSRSDYDLFTFKLLFIYTKSTTYNFMTTHKVFSYVPR